VSQLEDARTRFDVRVRQQEGWCIDSVHGRAVITRGQTEPWAKIFATHEEARAFVQRKAEEGSAYHRDVLVHLALMAFHVDEEEA
jgi:hypothetical protein